MPHRIRPRAPKGRSNEAQAEGLGQQNPHQSPSPAGAEQSSLIPHVPLVVRDFVRVRAAVGWLMCGVGRGANAIAGIRIPPLQGWR